jgi:type III pantothenate kinase
MLLTIDVGNTNIVFGVFNGEVLVNFWRLNTNKSATADEIGVFLYQILQNEGINLTEIDDIIISSVVPSIMYAILHMTQKYFKKEPLVIEPGIKTGLHIKYDNPKQVGADRIVNAVAGLRKYGGPLIIVDFGTATTFCAITEKNEYLGGAIAPGIVISSEALFQNAAKLTRVELQKPNSAIAKNTASSIQSGIYYGYVGLVDNIISKFKEELGLENVKVIATGGLSALIAPESRQIQIVDKMLTLDGLRFIYELNKK